MLPRTLLLLALPLAAQEPPRIASIQPAPGALVDATLTTRLVVAFDRDMDTRGFSLCRQGPGFPPLQGMPRWEDARTLVAEVRLEPDRRYVFALNGPGAMNTRSREGMPLPPEPWAFLTLPRTLRPPGEQRARNDQALSALARCLDEHYAHRDLRVTDWAALRTSHSEQLLETRSDLGFASAAASMLRAARDPHLVLRRGEDVFPTFSPEVDPLWRRHGILAEVPDLEHVGPGVLAGRTPDGFGYILVATWNASLDQAALDTALAGFSDTRGLVFDVRPNGGGDERRARAAAAWFVEGTRVYGRHRFRTGPGPEAFGPVQERSLEGRPTGRGYAGPVALLVGPAVMSSNESFVLMMRQARDCAVIGLPTFGSSGNPKPFPLGNGVTALIPTWQDLDGQGLCFESRGHVPDILVPCSPAELERGDPILARALEHLRNRTAR